MTPQVEFLTASYDHAAVTFVEIPVLEFQYFHLDVE